MKKFTLLLLLMPSLAFSNDTFYALGENVTQAMTELAADPPLPLLKNIKGESKHEIILAYITTETDDNATRVDGTISHEKSDMAGFGISYGYSYSFKEKWAFSIWAQGLQIDGDVSASVGGSPFTQGRNAEGTIATLSTTISYEFLRKSENHTLTFFAGPSLFYVDMSSDITQFSLSTPGGGDFEGASGFNGLFPAITSGVMYDYNFAENWQITPYALYVLALTDDCQEYELLREDYNNVGTLNGSHPNCTPSDHPLRGEFFLSNNFGSIGIKFNYVPWDIGFNISSSIRNILFPNNGASEGDPDAEVTSTVFSISKAW